MTTQPTGFAELWADRGRHRIRVRDYPARHRRSS
jgi:hypothetical protein